jgi:hypothetical protein
VRASFHNFHPFLQVLCNFHPFGNLWCNFHLMWTGGNFQIFIHFVTSVQLYTMSNEVLRFHPFCNLCVIFHPMWNEGQFSKISSILQLAKFLSPISYNFASCSHPTGIIGQVNLDPAKH